jgi:AcrR family transcriptional regulator
MNTSRSYQMNARADAVRETRARIVAAAGEAILQSDYNAITLEAVGRAARVSVQTIIRHFGSKDGLFREASENIFKRVVTSMDAIAVGDVRGAIEALHARYEWMGDGNIRFLAQQETPGLIADGTKAARRYHRSWVERIFDPYLPPKGDTERRNRLFQLLIVCDVYTWKLLRRDHGGSRAATTEAILGLANAIVGCTGDAR